MLISVFVTNGCNMKCSYCYEGLLKDKSSFDSNKLFVVKDYANKKFILKSGNKYGFYPFNNENDDTKNPDKRNLYFTARFDIPFLMTKDGKTLNSETGKYDDMVVDANKVSVIGKVLI